MVIALTNTSINRTNYMGDGDLILTSGTKFRIRDNETGEWVDSLDVKVPNGKKWVVKISLNIVETDA